MPKITLLILSFFIIFTSCSSTPNERLKISVTTWIGYSPLFYAKEKDWLKEFNIKLLNVSSLSENMYLYQAGNSDAYVGTQYEYSILKTKDKSLTPIMMLDRSDGGDMILSNLTIKELQNTNQTIDAYLELDSINNTLLKYFISKYFLEDKNINYINKDQTEISYLHATDMKNPTLIVTYTPYNTSLKKNGFKEIASTKDSIDLIIVDAMFTRIETLNKHKKQFKALKILIDKAIVALHKDPKEFYETIKPYMLDMSYDDFTDSLNNIIWINTELSNDLKNHMTEINFSTRNLL